VSLFAVVREAGPGWAAGGITEQPAVDAHAAFMEALVREEFLLVAGPLAGSEQGRLRVLLVVDAEDQAEIESRLGGDPWQLSEQLVTASVESWKILAGATRLAPTQTARITPTAHEA
jgi:uncharacterized protein YciI